jgi:hypothetical protein
MMSVRKAVLQYVRFGETPVDRCGDENIWGNVRQSISMRPTRPGASAGHAGPLQSRARTGMFGAPRREIAFAHRQRLRPLQRPSVGACEKRAPLIG